MSGAPGAVRALGLAALLPVLWGTLTRLDATLYDWTLASLGPRFVAPYVVLYVGTILLAFLSGALWGFAMRADGKAARMALVLAVLPAIWAFLFTGIAPAATDILLIAGFALALGIDWLFWKTGLAPRWWFPVKVRWSAAVMVCLALEGSG